MNCIIIDDEATARLVLTHMCSQTDEVTLVDEFPDAIEAIKFLNKNEVDLIFLDIHMPGLTGFDFIQTIKNPPSIVLTTSDEKFAIDAFEYDCIVDYLVKPITLPRFIKSVQKAKYRTFVQEPVVKVPEPVKKVVETPKEQQDSVNDLFVNIDKRLIRIKIPSILMIEAKGDYIQIKTEAKNYIVHSTMKNIAEKLPKDLFFKIHRSYIINLKRIVDIEDNSVLVHKELVPVSRANKPELLRRLNLL